MRFSDWVEDDGVHESIVYLFDHEKSTPILKARAVLKSDGEFESVIRDFNSGIMVSTDPKSMPLDVAKKRSMSLSRNIIYRQLDHN